MIPMKKIIITIDGPAGAGKSITAEQVAAHFKLAHYSSGATYRAITYALLKINRAEDYDEETLQSLKIVSDGNSIFYDGVDVTPFLREKEVDRMVVIVSKTELVRGKAAQVLKNYAKDCVAGLVVEGRDIGSVVLPDAEFKFFLDANVEQRALRRIRQFEGLDFEETKKLIILRDFEDINRKHGPLVCPKNAVVIDNGDLSIEETVKTIIDFVEKRIKTDDI